MKKIIALIAMAGLIVGCSHFRHKESNTGGTSDTTQMNTGSSSDKTSSGINSSSSSTQNSQSTSDSSSSNPSDKTPK